MQLLTKTRWKVQLEFCLEKRERMRNISLNIKILKNLIPQDYDTLVSLESHNSYEASLIKTIIRKFRSCFALEN